MGCTADRKAGNESKFNPVDFVVMKDSLTYYWHRFAKDSTLVTVKSNETIISECTIVVAYENASSNVNGVVDIDCKDSIFVIYLKDIDISERKSIWNLNKMESSEYSPEVIIQAAEDYHRSINSNELPSDHYKK